MRRTQAAEAQTFRMDPSAVQAELRVLLPRARRRRLSRRAAQRVRLLERALRTGAMVWNQKPSRSPGVSLCALDRSAPSRSM